MNNRYIYTVELFMNMNKKNYTYNFYCNTIKIISISKKLYKI